MFNIATHNGTITVANTHKGTHRTFRIRTQKPDAKFAPNARILSMLTGPDNTSDYQQLGFVNPDGSIRLWSRFRSERYEAFADVLRRPEAWTKAGCEYHYEGRCRVCNRTLTTPESIESGIGPKCASKKR